MKNQLLKINRLKLWSITSASTLIKKIYKNTSRPCKDDKINVVIQIKNNLFLSKLIKNHEILWWNHITLKRSLKLSRFWQIVLKTKTNFLIKIKCFIYCCCHWYWKDCNYDFKMMCLVTKNILTILKTWFLIDVFIFLDFLYGK